MADFLLIDQVLQYLHKAPDHKWEKFELVNVEYFDVNLFDLHYEPYTRDESEELAFDIKCIVNGKTITVPCSVRRSESHIILTPTLRCTVDKIDLLGTRGSGYNLDLIKEALKLYTSVSIEIVILERFLKGELDQLWNFKPEI